MLLCDAAQVVGGKLFLLGGGWSIIGPAPTPMAIAIKLDVPWDQAEQPHVWELSLVDQDGEPVQVATEQGPTPLVFRDTFQTGRPPDVPPGTPLDVALAFNVGPVPLRPGQRFEWRFAVDGQVDEAWRLAFTVRAAPAGQTPPPGATA
jgi:hypothetical protein